MLVELSSDFFMQMTEQIHITKAFQFSVELNDCKISLAASFGFVSMNEPVIGVSSNHFGVFVEKTAENRFNLFNSLSYEEQLVATLSFGFNLLEKPIYKLRFVG